MLQSTVALVVPEPRTFEDAHPSGQVQALEAGGRLIDPGAEAVAWP